MCDFYNVTLCHATVQAVPFGLLGPEDVNTMILQHVTTYAALQSRRPESERAVGTTDIT